MSWLENLSNTHQCADCGNSVTVRGTKNPEKCACGGEMFFAGCASSLHAVQSDCMGAIKSMADGKMYDSKSSYTQAVKDAGYTIMGNDAPKEVKRSRPRGDFNCREELKQAVQQILPQRRRKRR